MNKASTDPQTLVETTACDVAILFCDLRGIASVWSTASAVEVILLINSYISDISQIIGNHHGIINQFIGDTILAIFGLEVPVYDCPVEQAIQAGLAIIAHNNALDSHNIAEGMGIGIDVGVVRVGIIDANPCYQYLIIDESSTQAKYLQALSNDLGCQMLVSQRAYTLLPEQMRQGFINLGDHTSSDHMPFTVYGINLVLSN